MRGAGYDGLTIGMETADDEALCFMVGANMLTIYPDSKLYEEIQRGNWQEESEP